MGIWGTIGRVGAGIATGGMSEVAMSGLGQDILTGGAVSNAKSVEATNAANFAESQKNRDFQERMSNTGYQRGVLDMEKAGLNKALAYTNGPASTPTGSTATATAPRKGDIGAGLLNTAKGIASQGAELKQVGANTDLARANTEVSHITAQKLGANAKEAELNQELIKANTKKANEEAERSRIAKKVEKAQLPAAEKSAKADNLMAYPDAVLERIKSWIPLTRSSARNYNFKGSGDNITNNHLP